MRLGRIVIIAIDRKGVEDKNNYIAETILLEHPIPKELLQRESSSSINHIQKVKGRKSHMESNQHIQQDTSKNDIESVVWGFIVINASLECKWQKDHSTNSTNTNQCSYYIKIVSKPMLSIVLINQ